MNCGRKTGFTLVELLVTMAIVAVVGAGVAVHYGREVVDDARRKMTLHEMGQIRDAFLRFYADNCGQLMDGLTVADSATALPDAFGARFIASDSWTYSPPDAANPQRLYGMFEFFERYGLWLLFSRSVGDLTDSGRKVQIFRSSSESAKYGFSPPSAVTGAGWRGPYLDSPSRIDCVPHLDGGYVPQGVVRVGSVRKRAGDGTVVADGEVRFPQPATRYDDGNGGFYRVVYFEHCPDDGEGHPIYRRLLLMAAENPSAFDSEAEIARFRGNRRYNGIDAAPPIDEATGAIKAHDAAHGVFFYELLNFDTVCR